jgi:signal transduction histidine kinase
VSELIAALFAKFRWPAAARTALSRGTIRRQLIILTAVLVVPAALASAFLLTYTFFKDRRAAEHQLLTTARALSLVVDRQLGEAEAVVRSLATSRSLVDGDYAAFDRQARAADTIEGSWIVVRDAGGHQRVNTRLPPGAALPTDNDGALKRRPQLMNGPLVTNLLRGPGDLGPRVAIVMPVERDGGFLAEVDIALRPSTFDAIFRDQQLPPRWICAVVDSEGTIVRRSRDPENSIGLSVTAVFKGRLAMPEAAGTFESKSLEGEPTSVAYSRSPRTGWIFSVTVPRDALGAAARRSLFLSFAIALALIGLGVILARRIAGSITGPVEGLVQRAITLGRGAVPPRGATGLAEADLVADALWEAGESIRGFTTMLERKVEDRTRDLEDANRLLSNEITERKRAEQQLARIQRLEAVGQLSGGIAHDFNNLLQAIVGNVDLAKFRTTDPKARTYLDHALTAADRGSKLTGQLLAFARKQRMAPMPVDIREVVAGITEMLHGTIDDSIEIVADFPEFLWPALSDPTQLELMVVNLAINARDAMPDGGCIVIGGRNVTRREPTRPEEPPAGEFVELSVRDTGAGIPPDVLGKVFEPFFTTKGVGKGSGLGLSQVLGLSQQLGGGVVIESEIGWGTVVKLYLQRTT